MKGLAALFVRDLRLAWRAGGGALTGVLFYAIIAAITPFAIGPDLALLAQLAPAILWIGALLALLLGLDRLFQADVEDGSQDGLMLTGIPLEVTVLTKILAHWVSTALPLVVATPVIGIFLNMPPAVSAVTMATLALGTPALTALGAIGAALTVTLRRGGVLVPVLVLPLSVPVVIFGVAAANAAALGMAVGGPILILAALSLAMLVVGPVASAAALRSGD